MEQALAGMGFTGVVFRGRSGQQHRFSADQHDGVCPCCDGEHTGNCWHISEEGPRYNVRNYSDQCRVKHVDSAGRSPAAVGGQTPFADFLVAMAGEWGLQAADVPCAALRDEQVVEFRVRTQSGLARGDGENEENEEMCQGCSNTHPAPAGREYILQQLGAGSMEAWHIRDAAVRCPGRIVWTTPAFRGSAELFAKDEATTALAEFFYECHATTMSTDDAGLNIRVSTAQYGLGQNHVAKAVPSCSG